MQDIINQLSHLRHTLIAGLPGTGKDLLASLAVKALKQQQRQLTVYVIDLKADCKENYYDNCADIIRSQNISQMMAESLENLFNWIKSCFDEFAQITGKKLLILSEANLLFHKFSQNKDIRNWLVDKILTYLSVGDSSGAYLWFIGQTFNFQDIGLGRSVLSVINLVFIVNSDNLANYDYICQTLLIPPRCRLSAQEITAIAAESPVNRAVYLDGHWSPMSVLTHA